MAELPAAAGRVAAALRDAGESGAVVLLPASARTAPEAADACDCALGQIVKSLVFQGDNGLWLILVAGDNRVNEARLGGLIGERLGRAEARAVRSATGFAIGGVPPIGHAARLPCVMDETLMRFDTVWAAAGRHDAVFAIAPRALLRISGARLLPVA